MSQGCNSVEHVEPLLNIKLWLLVVNICNPEIKRKRTYFFLDFLSILIFLYREYVPIATFYVIEFLCLSSEGNNHTDMYMAYFGRLLEEEVAALFQSKL